MVHRKATWGIVLLIAALGCGDSGSDGSGDGVKDACDSFCEVAVDCDWLDSSECDDTCTDDLEGAYDFLENCGRRNQQRYECLGSLSCSEFDDWVDEEPPNDFPCRDEERATEDACSS